MGKVVTSLTRSLDGFIAGPGDDVRPLFGRYFGGDVEVRMEGGGPTFKLSPASAAVFQESIARAGAMGRDRRSPF